MNAPSNANTSGLEVVAWRKNVWVAEGIGTGWMLSNEQPEPSHQPTDIEPLVTAASAQERIAGSEKKAELYDHMKLVAEANGFKSLTEAIARATAAEARADRLAEISSKLDAAISCLDYPFIDNRTPEAELRQRVGFMMKDAEPHRAALQQETQP